MLQYPNLVLSVHRLSIESMLFDVGKVLVRRYVRTEVLGYVKHSTISCCGYAHRHWRVVRPQRRFSWMVQSGTGNLVAGKADVLDVYWVFENELAVLFVPVFPSQLGEAGSLSALNMNRSCHHSP